MITSFIIADFVVMTVGNYEKLINNDSILLQTTDLLECYSCLFLSDRHTLKQRKT